MANEDDFKLVGAKCRGRNGWFEGVSVEIIRFTHVPSIDRDMDCSIYSNKRGDMAPIVLGLTDLDMAQIGVRLLLMSKVTPAEVRNLLARTANDIDQQVLNARVERKKK